MRTATGLFLGLGACLTSFAVGKNQDHAMDFLKMVEAQAAEWDDRKLQLIKSSAGTQGIGGLVSAISSASKAAVGSSSGLGAGGGILNELLGGGSSGGNDKGFIGASAAEASVDTTVTPVGKPFVPSLGDGGNAMGLPTVGAAVKRSGAAETCGAPLTIAVESLTEYRVYVDGNQVGYSNGVQMQRYETTYGSSGAVTVAIEATRDREMSNFASVDGLAVNVTVCGETFISDQDWVCTDTRPWTTTWRLGSYTPFQWMHAALVRDAAKLVDGSTSFAIWAKPSCDSKPGVPEQAFCRLTLKPTTPCPKYLPCYAEQTTSPPDTGCLTGCVMETVSKDKCATIAHQLAGGCGSCSSAFMTYYRQYCRTQGCSAEQCQMPLENDGFTPNSACLDGCGLKTFKSQCEQQAHQFQSGCASSCGPETLAFARDKCLSSFKCSPTQCSIFADKGAVDGGLANQVGTGGGTGGGSTGGGEVAPSPSPEASPGYTPPPTPDLTCFFRCLNGMNKLDSYCDKINYALTANCHNCPDKIIEWAKTSCVDYQDPDGNKCSPEQCAAT